MSNLVSLRKRLNGYLHCSSKSYAALRVFQERHTNEVVFYFIFVLRQQPFELSSDNFVILGIIY